MAQNGASLDNFGKFVANVGAFVRTLVSGLLPKIHPKTSFSSQKRRKTQFYCSLSFQLKFLYSEARCFVHLAGRIFLVIR
jgi:hypothetical protein